MIVWLALIEDMEGTVVEGVYATAERAMELFHRSEPFKSKELIWGQQPSGNYRADPGGMYLYCVEAYEVIE